MHYFLLDANVLVAYYCKDEPEEIRSRVGDLFAARAQGKAFLYVPNFCVAEVLKAFAKKCWQEKIYDASDFGEFRRTFLADVVDSKVLYSYELSRRHIKMTDRILERAAKLSFRTGSPPSALDLLIIAMGTDLSQVHGSANLHIVTAERPIFDVCQQGDDLPKVLHVGEREIPDILLRG